MSVRIWKYSVPGHCEGPVKQVLGTEMQYGKPVVWVMLDDDIKETRAIDFYSCGTGWDLDGNDAEVMRNSAYCGTLKDEEGYIWHVFCVSVPTEAELKERIEKKKELAATARTTIEASDEEDESEEAQG